MFLKGSIIKINNVGGDNSCVWLIKTQDGNSLTLFSFIIENK